MSWDMNLDDTDTMIVYMYKFMSKPLTTYLAHNPEHFK